MQLQLHESGAAGGVLPKQEPGPQRVGSSPHSSTSTHVVPSYRKPALQVFEEMRSVDLGADVRSHSAAISATKLAIIERALQLLVVMRPADVVVNVFSYSAGICACVRCARRVRDERGALQSRAGYAAAAPVRGE